MAEAEKKRVEVRAKMSGVFYRKPSPDEPPYVEVGSVVKKKQVLALLETMKVFQKVNRRPAVKSSKSPPRTRRRSKTPS